MTSLLVRGARLIDGTGSDERPADVAVVDGVITEIGAPATLARSEVDRVIDAAGLVLASGLIDAHSHDDAVPMMEEIDLSKISQGVTTEVVGNCGFSLAPCPEPRRSEIAALCGRLFPELPFDWATFPELFARIDAAGSVLNVVSLAGHHLLRAAAMGLDDRRPTPAELDHMRNDLRAALVAGASGLSSGLIYPPGMFASTDELASLAAVLSPQHVYATHIRGEGRQLMSSIDEAIAVARQAHTRLQVSHLKAAGRQAWGTVPAALDRMDAAYDSGILVHHDVYPYTANSTMLASCLPPWFHDGGHAHTMARLRDPAALRRARDEVLRDDGSWENWVAGSGWSNVLVASTEDHQFEGVTLDRVAYALGTSEFDALVHLLLVNDLKATMSVFAMSEADVVAALIHPRAIVGSDGLPPGHGGKPHPRSYGTFTRVLGHYVRDAGCLSLSEAIAKMTSRAAAVFGLHDRGVLAVGAAADLVLFDPDTVSDTATFLEPTQLSRGIELVVVNGTVNFEKGKATGARPGRRLRSGARRTRMTTSRSTPEATEQP